MAAVAAAAREEAVPRARAQSAAAAAESGSGPSRRTRTESSVPRQAVDLARHPLEERGGRRLPSGAGGAVGTVASGARAAQSTFSIPNSSSGPYGSQDSVHSSPEDGGSSGGRDRPASGGPGGPRLVIGSLPAHLSPHMFGGFKCPVCSKFVPSDEMDLHLVMCLTKPRITYNGFKCPVCSKFVPSDEMDLHLVMCLTKPRITYNGRS
nr:E3 ubiquitin-protein ligase ZNRF2 [Odocoileus virginianus texanus]